MKSNAFYEPYPKYKPSGVKWLGDVPAHWSLVQLGRIGTFQKCSGGTKADEVPEGIPCVRYGDLYTSHRAFIEHTRSFITECKAGEYTPIKYGDILFAGSGETIDEIGISAVNLIESQLRGGGDIILFRPQLQMDARFSGYLLDSSQSRLQKSCMGRGITVMHVYASELKYLWLSIPPLEEQTAIVRYLDDADERIQRAISAKERLVELLTEQRQAVVNRAVTRGLDPNVLLRDSCVDWLGDVPVHWDVRRLKSAGSIRYGLGQPPREAHNGLPLIRATNVERGRITDQGMLYVDPDDVPKGRDAILRTGEIIVVRSGAYTADSAIVPNCYEGAVSGYDMVVTAMESIRPKFLAFALLSTYLRDHQLIVASTRSAQPHLNAEELGTSILLLPPVAEQTAIVRFLDKATSEIDDSMYNAQRQIDLLREYRTRLIADVVTGQVDVRGAEVN